MFNKQQILEVVEKHKAAILENWPVLTDNAQVRGRKFSSTSPVDMLLMFAFILEKKPSHIIEFSPAVGYSTTILAAAMKVLGKQKSFVTFEQAELYKDILNKRFKKYQVEDYVRVVWGEAIKNIKDHLSKNKDWSVGFIFSDCCHRKEFSRKYTKEIFPLLEKDAIIFVHDVSSNDKGEFCTNSPSPADEHIGIKEWVDCKKPKFILTHKEFGGQVERSASLEIDHDFFNKLKDILGKNILDHEESAPVCFVALNP